MILLLITIAIVLVLKEFNNLGLSLQEEDDLNNMSIEEYYIYNEIINDDEF